MTLAPPVTSDALNVVVSTKSFPLKMSFWPRGRTLVRGWRRDLRSPIVASSERVTGIDLPLNLTVIVIPVVFDWRSLASPVVAPASSIFLLSQLCSGLCGSLWHVQHWFSSFLKRLTIILKLIIYILFYPLALSSSYLNYNLYVNYAWDVIHPLSFTFEKSWWNNL